MTMENKKDVFELIESPIKMNEAQFEALWGRKPVEAQYCSMYGKTIEVPRNYEIYGVNYKFAGQENGANEVPEELQEYLAFGNSILVNWYENGDKYIGYHSDDERGLSGCIYGFSYGAERRFKFMEKATKEVTTLMLPNNSLVIMKENTQKLYKHSLPVMKKVGRRISITVRTLSA
jgi:alkylated DNA repair dioxygenase AlkB